jgi:hypothetical protein
MKNCAHRESKKVEEREMCNVIESRMLGGGDEKSTPTNIWEGVMDLVNGNMFTHNHRSLNLYLNAILAQ